MINNKSINIGGEEWFLITSFFIIALLVVFSFLDSSLNNSIQTILGKVTDFLLKQGYVGAFLVPLLTNATVFVVIPYLPVIFFLGSIGLNPLLVGLIAGVGATLGEIISYAIGWGGAKILMKKHSSRLQHLNKLLAKRPGLASFLVFLLAILPIPDDIVVVPLGVIRYPLVKAISPLFIGKTSLMLVVALFGSSLANILEPVGQTGEFIWPSAISLSLTILVIYLTLKVKWERFLENKSVSRLQKI